MAVGIQRRTIAHRKFYLVTELSIKQALWRTIANTPTGASVSPHVIGNMARASEHWLRGDKCLAHIHLAHAGLPEIDAAGAYRLALGERALAMGVTLRAIYKALDLDAGPLSLFKFDPDQPRVPVGSGRESGRWTSGDATAGVREGRSVSPHSGGGENAEEDKLEDFKAKLGEETDEEAVRHGRPLDPLDTPAVGGAPAVRAPAAASSKTELVGNNVQPAGGRWNTDLPRGLSEAKAVFERLTVGQGVRTETTKDGVTRTIAEDGTQLRINADGSIRIDRSGDFGAKNHETIHFNQR